MVKIGDQYIFEAAIDLTKAGAQIPAIYNCFNVRPGEYIRFEIQYNDCENGRYENQIGWTFGPPWNTKSFGKLFF
jgi:hypothetical protein